MAKIRDLWAIWPILLLVCLGVQSAEPQDVHLNSAIKDLSIMDGATCNEPGVSGIVEYLKNRNKSKSIVAKITRTDSASQGKPESHIETYTVPPNGKVELGCNRADSGAPIVVDTSWEIKSAKYK